MYTYICKRDIHQAHNLESKMLIYRISPRGLFSSNLSSHPFQQRCDRRYIQLSFSKESTVLEDVATDSLYILC